jgi:putative FmdB family regulatory protein
MPLYEYKCKKCGHRFERIQSYTAPDVKECPVCQGEVERLISAPVAHFKGSGFYSTDYAPKPAASSSSDGNSATSDKSGSDKAGSDKAGSDKGSAAKTETTSTTAAPTSSSKADQ